MSKIEVNAIEPQSGTTLTLGASGDTITIPSGATINNQGSAVNFGPTGAVSWNTTKVTTGFTATAGIGYFCDTTSAAFTVTLPSSPAAGAVIGITDYANTFATNNLTVGRNGSNIGGIAFNATLSTNGIAVTFVYVDSTQGWIVTDSGNRSDLPTATIITATGGTITTCGNFKIHTFTGPGTFTVSAVGNPAGSTTVDYLVVAGGGGTGSGLAGGGGAGGYRTNFPSSCAGVPVSVTTYPITVGSGGAATTPDGGAGTPGNSSIFSTITSTGGGGSVARPPGPVGPGGSGGGAAGAQLVSGGTGNTPPVSPPQGNPGGQGTPSGQRSGGGGGGAGGAGGNSSPTAYGPGGVGAPNLIYNSPTVGTPGPAPGRYFAGGGGGNGDTGGPVPSGLGGAGGGGTGGGAGTQGTAGTANTGGGGGGGGTSTPNGSAGGSGIVIIRYKFQ
jgi:hypothetical protein